VIGPSPNSSPWALAWRRGLTPWRWAASGAREIGWTLRAGPADSRRPARPPSRSAGHRPHHPRGDQGIAGRRPWRRGLLGPRFCPVALFQVSICSRPSMKPGLPLCRYRPRQLRQTGTTPPHPHRSSPAFLHPNRSHTSEIHRDAEIADRAAFGGETNLGITREVPDQHNFVSVRP